MGIEIGCLKKYVWEFCNDFGFGFRSTIEQKNSTSLPSDNTKNQDAGQQNNQGRIANFEMMEFVKKSLKKCGWDEICYTERLFFTFLTLNFDDLFIVFLDR